MKFGMRKPSIKKEYSSENNRKSEEKCKKSYNTWIWKKRKWMD